MSILITALFLVWLAWYVFRSFKQAWTAPPELGSRSEAWRAIGNLPAPITAAPADTMEDDLEEARRTR